MESCYSLTSVELEELQVPVKLSRNVAGVDDFRITHDCLGSLGLGQRLGPDITLGRSCSRAAAASAAVRCCHQAGVSGDRERG